MLFGWRKRAWCQKHRILTSCKTKINARTELLPTNFMLHHKVTLAFFQISFRPFNLMSKDAPKPSSANIIEPIQSSMERVKKALHQRLKMQMQNADLWYSSQWSISGNTTASLQHFDMRRTPHHTTHDRCIVVLLRRRRKTSKDRIVELSRNWKPPQQNYPRPRMEVGLIRN